MLIHSKKQMAIARADSPTQKIFQQRNNNLLQRLVMKIKLLPDLDFNPKLNVHNPIYFMPYETKP